jgi:acyl-coenzyme A thioesterase PaaI-like protein
MTTSTGQPASGEDQVRPGRYNLMGDMAVQSLLVSKERAVIMAPLTESIVSSFGGASLGAVTMLVDLGTSGPALASMPDWTATQDLSVYGAGPLTEGPIVVDNHLVRLGKKVIVASAEVYDAHGFDDIKGVEAALASEGRGGLSLAAKCLVTFARLPRSAAADVEGYDPSQWIGDVKGHGEASPGHHSIVERMGLRLVDPSTGTTELELTPYVANSIGTINGGAQAMMVEAAAEMLCPGFKATDVQLHYLAQVRGGPARTTGLVLRREPGHAVVNVEITDAGSADRLLTSATVTLVQPS